VLKKPATPDSCARFDLMPQRIIAGAGLHQKRRARAGFQRQRSLADQFDVSRTLRSHGF